LAEADVTDYLGARVLPLLCELGIEEFSVMLVPKQGGTVLFSTSSSSTLTERDVKCLISCLNSFESSRFVLEMGLESCIGYSENDLDWVVMAVPVEYRFFCEELMGPLWYQFFEY
jgi:hypothetical protein